MLILSELMLFDLCRGSRKKEVIDDVREPIKPIPTIISIDAIIRPIPVEGDRSP